MSQLKIFFLDVFEKYQGFRRLVFVYVMWLAAYLSIESIALVALAITHNSSLLELSGSFVAIYGPLMAIIAFVSKLYWESRDKES